MEEIKEQIKKKLQEAELYSTQGLLSEAKERYKNAALIIKQ